MNELTRIILQSYKALDAGESIETVKKRAGKWFVTLDQVQKRKLKKDYLGIVGRNSSFDQESLLRVITGMTLMLSLLDEFPMTASFSSEVRKGFHASIEKETKMTMDQFSRVFERWERQSGGFQKLLNESP
jgi:hypothetical protein